MKRLLHAIRRRPWLALTMAIGCAAVLGGVGTVGYAFYVQPDPYVVSQPMAWQKEAGPLPNTGQDATGMTLDQWIASGKTPHSYQPVPKSIFRPGETMWTLRYDCFVNKTAEGMVSRAFLGGDGTSGLQTSRSMYILPDLQIPTRTDGCAVKNHRTLIPADLPSGVWTYQVSVNFYKNPMQPSVRVLFKPVIITVVK
jgi:hypothetical protein